MPSLPRDASQPSEVISHYPHVILANRTEGFLRSYGSAASSLNQAGWKTALSFCAVATGVMK